MRITRLFIDNYKCFVGFDFKPQAIQPIFGLNGTGKSTLFQVLESLRHFVLGRSHSAVLFPSSTLTRWDARNVQTFRVETESPRCRFEYELVLSHDRQAGYAHVQSETLTSGGAAVFHRREGSTKYFRDDGSEAPGVLLDVRYSGIGFQNPSIDSERLTAFRQWAAVVVNISLSPTGMSSRSEHEERELDWGGTNFASWMRHLTQSRLSSMVGLIADLREVLDGFENLTLVPEGNVRVLRAEMRHLGGPITQYDFSELSDGQRVLAVLYSVFHGHLGTDAVLCMDEPANYLALAEIQPYLIRLRDAVGDGLAQLFIVTHNPEAINYMAPDGPILFDREDGGPVRLLPFPETNPDGISAAELLARGWVFP